MDENLSWKIVYLATIFSLIIMGIAYYFIAPRESPFFTEEKMEKIAEFKTARIAGRKKGEKVWEFFAKEGWTAKDREITYLYEVSKGKIYKDGDLVVSDLSAPWAKAYRHSEIVEAFGHPEGKKEGRSKLHAYLELGKISKDESNHGREWTKLTANYLKYIPAEKCSIIEGDVELQKNDSSISSQKIKVDHEQKVADISEEIRLKRKDGFLVSDRLKYISDEERLEADGHVTLNVSEGQLKTQVKSKHASFYTDIAKDVSFLGSLEALQGKKLAIAQAGVYSQEKKELVMKGEVKAIFEKAQVVLKEETVQNLKNPEAQGILKEKTILTSNQLIFSTRNGDAQARGSVYVTQKGREAKSELALYNEEEEILTLTGNVFMKKEKEWVSAEKVMVSVRDETFEAIGAVEAEFKL
ncbi:hypothetical protein AMJ44_09795 [candidate division WOR-1 bacterium DG_54_3]|uniref:Organic solvent tolerance-like N-terminal domain-containing protein n=1 Tax=candidate division WOR-1 bacterium DG_54_3 TaxID=1703775 RepID=A0A0S7XT04_UNCSA|nr:MAG: hypothetical protein AMJ44_09795 [candidate division WOR-1 bacterium DG_54_3]